MVVKELLTMGNSASNLATLGHKFCLDTPRTERAWRYPSIQGIYKRAGGILVYREFNESTEVS